MTTALRNLNQSFGGRRVLGIPHAGLPASAVVLNGDDGPSLLSNDVSAGDPAGCLYRVWLTSAIIPSGPTLLVYEDSSWVLTGAANGTTYTAGERVDKYDPTVGLVYSDTATGSFAVSAVSSVSSDLASTYAVRNAVSSSLTASYSLGTNVTSDLIASYGLRNAVSSSLAGVYAIDTFVVASLSAAYAIGSTVSADLAASYPVRGAVVSDLGETYFIHAAVAADLQGGYALRNALSSDLSSSYQVFNSAAVDLVGAFTIRGAVLSDFTGAYQMSSTINSDLKGLYSILNETGAIISIRRILDLDNPSDESDYVLRGGVWTIDTDPNDNLYYGLRVFGALERAGTSIDKVDPVVTGPTVTMAPFVKDPHGFVGVMLSGLDLSSDDAVNSFTYRITCVNGEQFDTTFELRHKDK